MADAQLYHQVAEEGSSSRKHHARVLVLDDEPSSRLVYALALKDAGCEITEASNVAELAKAVQEKFYDIVLADYYLENEDALEVIRTTHRYSPFSKVYVMTAREEIRLAVEVMETGAHSFIPKSLGPRKTAEKILAGMRSRALPQFSADDLGIIGESEEIQSLRSQIETIRNTKAHVLVSGETGTGKELVARALHYSSSRKKQRFEAVNCGAIPEQLLESELFGHKKGAFTDAKTDKRGLFEVCSQGTLFLDEIGEMPMALQVKLLRVLQERMVRPVGGERSIDVDTRIVAATNRNLSEEVAQGRFREDLFYRLSVLHMTVPPLRDRGDDVVLLFQHFLQQIAEENNKKINPPSREILEKVKSWPWRGNVRELHNAVERAVIMATEGVLNESHLFGGCSGMPLHEDEASGGYAIRQLPIRFSNAKKTFEKTYIDQLLTKSDGNIAAASRLSGKTRVEIYRLIDRNSIDLDSYRV